MAHQALRYDAGGDASGDAFGRGSFGDSEELLPLFSDPDARGPRKWSAMFDTDNCEEIDAREFLSGLPSLF